MELSDIKAVVNRPLFDELCHYLVSTYQVEPKIEYSGCSLMPGYNVKFRKSGRALCTLYPADGSFHCLIVIGPKQQAGFEELFELTLTVQEVYHQTKFVNGTGWLMIPVTDELVLEDIKRLIDLRQRSK